MAIITAGLVILLLAILIAPVANQTTGQVTGQSTSVQTGDVPFSQPLPSNNGGCSNENWANINGAYAKNNGMDFVNGVNDTDFTGKTLTSISVYLCRTSITNANSTIIGVFSNALTPVTRASFGTIVESALTTAYVQYTFSGSYVMQAKDIIGVEYYGNTPAGNTCNNSPTCAIVSLSCSPTTSCVDTPLANGGVVDTQTGRVGTSQFYTPGSTIAMSLCFSGVCAGGHTLNQNVTASPGISQVLPLYPLVFAGFGLVLVWITGTSKKGERGV